MCSVVRRLRHMASTDEKQRRVRRILDTLGRHTPEREAAILALDDEEKPSPLPSMAKLGFRLSAGATNRQLLDEVAGRTGRQALDREMRDYVQLPLREVGILAIATADPRNGRFIPNYWKPKSNNCVYTMDEELGAHEVVKTLLATRLHAGHGPCREERQGPAARHHNDWNDDLSDDLGHAADSTPSDRDSPCPAGLDHPKVSQNLRTSTRMPTPDDADRSDHGGESATADLRRGHRDATLQIRTP